VAADYELGKSVFATGCVTRLIDVVNRSPEDLEELVGFHRGRLSNGFHFLVLTDSLSAGDFEFFGYTYFSGGRIGLPSNHTAADQSRRGVHATMQIDYGDAGLRRIEDKFARAIKPKGVERYIKIAPVILHDRTMGSADQYPASRLGITQLNIRRSAPKRFYVAAKVNGSSWALADGQTVDMDKARYDQSYANDPRRRVVRYLSEL
jgi:hypothetical protein